MKKILIMVGMLSLLTFQILNAGQLAWDAPADSTIVGYKIYRSLGTSAFTSVGTVNVPTTTFTTTFDTNQVSRFYVVSYNSSNVESVPSNTVTNTPVIGPPPPLVYLNFEAESGVLVDPMAKYTDVNASGGTFIQTSGANDIGTATYSINFPYTGNYIIWFRVVFTDGGTDSIYITVDGGSEDIFGGSGIVVYSPNWQWLVVNGGNGVTIPRIFNVTAGTHTLMFRGRETGTKLDKFIVTNDMNYDPNVVKTISPPTNIRVTTVVP